MFSSAYEGQPLHEMHTSGSTGIPFVVQQDMGKRRRVIMELKAMHALAGYESHEKMLFIMGALRLRPYPWRQEFCENIYRIGVSVNDDASMKRLTDFLLYKKPTALNASASNLPPLVDYIRRRRIPPERFSLRLVLTGGEMVPDSLREDMRETFGDKCRVIVKYANEELGVMALDSGAGTPYRLNVADYYFEILKMDSDTPCRAGELGRIVVTDLYNFALPLIRYDTGDIGALERVEGGWPVLVKLNGKRRDLIFSTKGDSISGPAFTNLLKNTKNVKMWQIIQEGEKEYRYKIVPYPGTTPREKDILLPQLRDMLGEDAQITVEYSNDIPLISSQKRRYTVNLYRPQE